MPDKTAFTLAANVAKLDEDEQIVFGWASVSVGKDGTLLVDRQDDVIYPEDLEHAAYDFVLNSRNADDSHDEITKAHLVESMVFTAEKMTKMGITFTDQNLRKADVSTCMWWTGFYVPDAADWAVVKSSRGGFSIGGFANREPLEASA